jgi:hypothetical protein
MFAFYVYAGLVPTEKRFLVTIKNYKKNSTLLNFEIR